MAAFDKLHGAPHPAKTFLERESLKLDKAPNSGASFLLATGCLYFGYYSFSSQNHRVSPSGVLDDDMNCLSFFAIERSFPRT